MGRWSFDPLMDGGHGDVRTEKCPKTELYLKEWNCEENVPRENCIC